MTLRALYDLPAPAKLNLFLHVVGRRADGYHLLQSVFVLIDWCDTLHVERRDDGRLQRHDLGSGAARRRPVPARRAPAAGRQRHAAGRRHLDRQAPALGRRPGRRQFGRGHHAAGAEPALGPALAARAAAGARRCGSAPTCRSSSAATTPSSRASASACGRCTLPRQWYAVVKPAASLRHRARSSATPRSTRHRSCYSCGLSRRRLSR